MSSETKQFVIIMEKIDNLDRKILKIITQNARIPFREVAEQCGVSRAAVHQRVERMYDLGIIVGSGYNVNPKSLGYQLCVYVGITLEKGNMYRSVVSAIEQIPEVVESHYTLGPYAILAKMYARDDMHLLQLLTELQAIPGLAQTETLTALDQQVKRTIPIELSGSDE